MLLATIVAGIGAVIYFIWVGKRMGKTSELEKSIKTTVRGIPLIGCNLPLHRSLLRRTVNETTSLLK